MNLIRVLYSIIMLNIKSFTRSPIVGEKVIVKLLMLLTFIVGPIQVAFFGYGIDHLLYSYDIIPSIDVFDPKSFFLAPLLILIFKFLIGNKFNQHKFFALLPIKKDLILNIATIKELFHPVDLILYGFYAGLWLRFYDINLYIIPIIILMTLNFNFFISVLKIQFYKMKTSYEVIVKIIFFFLPLIFINYSMDFISFLSKGSYELVLTIPYTIICILLINLLFLFPYLRKKFLTVIGSGQSTDRKVHKELLGDNSKILVTLLKFEFIKIVRNKTFFTGAAKNFLTWIVVLIGVMVYLSLKGGKDIILVFLPAYGSIGTHFIIFYTMCIFNFDSKYFDMLNVSRMKLSDYVFSKVVIIQIVLFCLLLINALFFPLYSRVGILSTLFTYFYISSIAIYVVIIQAVFINRRRVDITKKIYNKSKIYSPLGGLLSLFIEMIPIVYITLKVHDRSLNIFGVYEDKLYSYTKIMFYIFLTSLALIKIWAKLIERFIYENKHKLLEGFRIND